MSINIQHPQVIIADNENELVQQLETLSADIMGLAIQTSSPLSEWSVWGRIDGQIDYSQPADIYRHVGYKIPGQIEKFQSLEFLDISSLALTDFSESIGKLKNLRILNISHNNIKLENVAYILNQLPKLERILAYGCPVTYESLRSIKLAKISYLIEDMEKDHEEFVSWKFKYYSKEPKRISEIRKVIKEMYDFDEANADERGEAILELLNRSKEVKPKWEDVLNQLRAAIPELKVYDMYMPVFPAYSLIIYLDDYKSDRLRETKMLNINLSPVTGTYTWYFHSSNELLKYKVYKSLSLITSIYYGEQTATESERQTLNTVITILKTNFPGYQYLRFKDILENHFEDITPLDDEVSTGKHSYNFFRLLFGVNGPQDDEKNIWD